MMVAVNIFSSSTSVLELVKLVCTDANVFNTNKTASGENRSTTSSPKMDDFSLFVSTLLF